MSEMEIQKTDEPTKVALITGSGRRRVGNAIAHSLAERGYSIALHYRSSKDAAEESVAEIKKFGVRCEAYQADVCDESQVDQMFDALHADFGRLDVLVTTASVWNSAPLEELTSDRFRSDFEVNVLGTFLCARRAGLQMVNQLDGGSIVTIGDWAIERPYLDHAAYFASKGAVPALTKALAVEFAIRNPKVRVNCVHPGPVMFPPDCSESERQDLVDSTLVKHADDPLVIASAVHFLAETRSLQELAFRWMEAAQSSPAKRLHGSDRFSLTNCVVAHMQIMLG